MNVATLVRVLDEPLMARDHLSAWGLLDAWAGQQVLLQLAESSLTLDLLAAIAGQLAVHLPRVADPDGVLAAFGRYVLAARSPLAQAALLERDAAAMPTLLRALALGPPWGELLVSDPDAFDLLRESSGRAISREEVVSQVQAETAVFDDERSIVAALARNWNRQVLRIVFGEATGVLPIAEVQRQLAHVGDALCGAALSLALERTQAVKALPRGTQGKLQVVMLATGDLGAEQFHLASDFELLVVYEGAAADAAALKATHEHVDHAGRLAGRWLAEASGGKTPRRVLLLRLPDGSANAAAHSAEDFVLGFDSFGRTWHREQMLKARPVAGDAALGSRLLSRLEPWLYRRYLNRADEAGIQALKRRILVRATLHQDEWLNVRWARGGIHDIDAATEWLQLLVGGDRPSVRARGTLAALQALAEAGTLALDEYQELSINYAYFCTVAHHLQVRYGHVEDLPSAPALLMAALGIEDSSQDAEGAILQWRQRQDRSWQILRKLLTSAFAEETPPAREVELLLDPTPSSDEVRAALAPFGFANPFEALAGIHDLATEQVPFLSTRRCRHLLASILPRLLTAISATPQPDATLISLTRVSHSIGGKGVLWDLFRFSPATLELYVKLCASSPYLSGILTTNPGMIDELIDSLQIDRLPKKEELCATLQEMLRGATDRMGVLHDFKNAEHLSIGVRDLLGKEDIDRTHAALADVAETCLAEVVDQEYSRLTEKYGEPTIGLGPFEGEPCRLIVLALGKLGGREPNYHSPLDLLLLYEAEGTTKPTKTARRAERTANNHFFTQLAQRITKQVSELTPKGRLYAIEMPLRPIGIGGALAMTLDDLNRHFREGTAPLWHWQALCQARPIFGHVAAQEAVRHLIEQLLRERSANEADFAELRRSRLELERGAETENLKRGPGGTLDVEYLVQGLQLHFASAQAEVLETNTQQAIARLASAGRLKPDVAELLGDNYRFLRRVESGLRLLERSARHDLPADRQDLAQLAYLLGHGNPDRLRDQCLAAMASNRLIFDQVSSR